MGEPLALISKITLLKVLVAQWTNHNSNCYLKRTELQAFHIWFQLCLLLFLLLSLRLNFPHWNKVSLFFHGSFLFSQSMLPWKNHHANWDGRRGSDNDEGKDEEKEETGERENDEEDEHNYYCISGFWALTVCERPVQCSTPTVLANLSRNPTRQGLSPPLYLKGNWGL